jgi:hypothetical protein
MCLPRPYDAVPDAVVNGSGLGGAERLGRLRRSGNAKMPQDRIVR